MVISKVDIAVAQLDVAIAFYMEDRNLIPAITLAGAAEEILGQLCERKQPGSSSLSRHAASCRQLQLHFRRSYPKLFPGDPGIKPFIDIRNETKNGLKHLISDQPIDVDLEGEAGQLITHAVENYVALFGQETARMEEFHRKRLRLDEFAG